MVIDLDDDDERGHTRRYTDNGINVLALDRHGRGLHRARPEPRFPTGGFTPPVVPERSWVATAAFVALMLGLLVLVLVRASG